MKLSESSSHLADDEIEDLEEEVFTPITTRRARKDSFRITQVLDSPHRITDDTIEEQDENPFRFPSPNRSFLMQNRMTRVGSVDSNSPGLNHRQHQPLHRTSSMSNRKTNNAAWKQLNDELNHLFPCKKSSNPNMQQLNNQNLQQRPTSPSVKELRKSASRSSLCCNDDHESEDEQIYLHTVHGGGRINTSRLLEPFSKITRRHSPCEDPSKTTSEESLWHQLSNGVRSQMLG